MTSLSFLIYPRISFFGETMINVAINGFGRIGKNIARILLQSEKQLNSFNLVAINDLGEPKVQAHLLKHDSVHGILPQKINSSNNCILVDNKKIAYFQEKSPAALPWKELNIDLVLECTGIFTHKKDAAEHLNAGAKKVIISAPGTDVDKTIVYGVNHLELEKTDSIISNASCTTNCLAPIASIINQVCGIESGIINTVHAFTNDQNVLDMYHVDPYRARATNASIIPTKTGAAKAIGQVLPELDGKLSGFATRVPVLNVSMLDLTFEAKRLVSLEEIKAALKEASQGELKGILAVNEDPLVSIDFNGNAASSIVDFNFMEQSGKLIKLIAWYDNECGFSNRMLDLANFWHSQSFNDVIQPIQKSA